MAMVSAIGGPPIALLYRNDAGPTVRANLGLVFAVGLSITISVRAAAGEVSWDEVIIGAALLPAVWLGLRVSRHLIPRVDGARLRNAHRDRGKRRRGVAARAGRVQLVKWTQVVSGWKRTACQADGTSGSLQ